MKPQQFKFDPERTAVGTVLRRVHPYLRETAGLTWDPKREGRLNDLVVGQVFEVGPTARFFTSSINWMESLIWTGNANVYEVRRETPRPGPFIGVLGNRYATPNLIGGVTHPLTGRANGIVTGGAVLDGLFGVNCIGFLNQISDPTARIRVRIQGILLDPDGNPLNLQAFVEAKPAGRPSGRTRVILVTGWATDSGKSTCVRGLTAALCAKGFRVTSEKKSGTACCKDWIDAYADCPNVSGRLDRTSNGTCTVDFDRFPARDFVDSLGIASDVSTDLSRFVDGSVRYTEALLAEGEPDFHIIELADGIAHRTNRALLEDPRFTQRISLLVYCPVPNPESVAHFLAYRSSFPGLSDIPLLLSGPIANEERFDMACLEAEERYGVRFVRSAVPADGGWLADGEAAAAAVQELLPGIRSRPADGRSQSQPSEAASGSTASLCPSGPPPEESGS